MKSLQHPKGFNRNSNQLQFNLIEFHISFEHFFKTKRSENRIRETGHD